MLVFFLILTHAASLTPSASFTPCPGSSSPLHFYPGTLPFHQTGHQDPKNSTSWIVTVSDPSHTYMTYGPYTNQISNIPQRVDFVLEIDNNSHDNSEILVLDVNDAESQKILVQRIVHRQDFAWTFRPQIFSLFFTNVECSRKLEFRVFYVCCAEVVHRDTIVAPLDPGDFGKKFFDGVLPKDHFELVSTSKFPTSPSQPGTAFANVGEDFVVDPTNSSIWWIFYREFGYDKTPTACQKKLEIARIVMRSTGDRGLTWSDQKWIIAEPDPSNPGANCAMVDGAAFFDPESSTWHYLSQCIGTEGGWNMCEFSFQGRNPSSGSWNKNPTNPVVRGGQLFKEICAGKGKHCSLNTVDEGTPEIVEKRNGLFYVTFHGYDYGAKKSARGIAATPDFGANSWITCSFDLPCDAIFSHVDCDDWKIGWAPGGCVGGGQASILRSGDYYYQLIEAPDVSLECLTSLGQQNWVYGWLRSPSLYFASGEWEEFQNPGVVPWVKRGCTLQYNRQFMANGRIYAAYYVLDFAAGEPQLQIWQLVSGQTPSLPIVAKMY